MNETALYFGFRARNRLCVRVLVLPFGCFACAVHTDNIDGHNKFQYTCLKIVQSNRNYAYWFSSFVTLLLRCCAAIANACPPLLCITNTKYSVCMWQYIHFPFSHSFEYFSSKWIMNGRGQAHWKNAHPEMVLTHIHNSTTLNIEYCMCICQLHCNRIEFK